MLALNSARGAQVSMPIMLVGVKVFVRDIISLEFSSCVFQLHGTDSVSNIDLCALSLDVLKQSAVFIIQ